MDYKRVLLTQLELQLMECIAKGFGLIELIKLVKVDYTPPTKLHTFDPEFPAIDISFLD